LKKFLIAIYKIQSIVICFNLFDIMRFIRGYDTRCWDTRQTLPEPNHPQSKHTLIHQYVTVTLPTALRSHILFSGDTPAHAYTHSTHTLRYNECWHKVRD